MQEQIIEKLKKLETITTQYEDVIKDEADDLKQECDIISSEKLQEHLSVIADENRLLTIGIIGRVKAGKSSLLNSIFFNGESVLPKAATPMTASLTVMTYGDSFSATVEYYTANDIDDIRKKHDDYKTKWDALFAKKIEELAKKRNETINSSEISAKATRQADMDLKTDPLNASYDQYERMKKTGKIDEVKAKNQTEKIAASNVQELLGKLNNYVGSEGPLMPFTKSAKLDLSIDALRDIQVVDTPGINDPVASREERTRDCLKDCDVVFIVSSACQFITKEDTELMDRLSSKGGVHELYFVASQVDNQLYGSAKTEANGILKNAIDKITADLSALAINTLTNIRNKNPATAIIFDKLIKECNNRVMVTSSICHAMSLRYDAKDSWDASMKHVWGLLTDNYPDYFANGETGKASLDSLSNIKTVQEKIEDARRQKDEIKKQKQEEELTLRGKAVEEYKEKLLTALSAKIELITNSDVEKIKEDKKNLVSLRSKGTEAIDGTFEDCIDELIATLRETISNNGKGLFSIAKSGVSDEEKSVTKTNRWTTGHLFWKKEHSENYEVTTVRAGAVKNTLSELLNDLTENVITSVETAKTEWKKKVQQRVTSELRNAVNDDELIPLDMLKTTLRRMMNSLILPEFDISSHSYSNVYEQKEEPKQKTGPFGMLGGFSSGMRSRTGTLEGTDAEEFISEVNEYLGTLRTLFTKKTNEFIKDIETASKKEKMSGMIFGDIDKQITQLEQEIGNKKLTLDRLDKCQKALQGI
jgi:GTPase Era involved in 16S rRNA processing